MLKVAVFIDHPLKNQSGGLAQCWKNLAQAAAVFESDLRLDIHFLGDRQTQEQRAKNIFYWTHPPLLGTQRFFFLKEIPDHADLVPLNPWVWSCLKKMNYDLLHTTNTFLAFAKTALRFAKRTQTPLTTSIQTDMASYIRLYTEKTLERFLPAPWAKRVAEKKEASFKRVQEKYLDQCQKVLFFRRGIDQQFFHPQKRDRTKLKQEFGIEPNHFVLLFIGRVDEGKSVMTLVEAARLLLTKKYPLHLLMVGKIGPLREKIVQTLGSHATLPGSLPHETLPWIYASADLFVFPSQIEVFPNVILEAKASGLPVLMHQSGGAAKVLQQPGQDGLVLETDDPKVWAEIIEGLYRSQTQRTQIAKTAREQMEKNWPSWEEVLAEDLLKPWQTLTSSF